MMMWLIGDGHSSKALDQRANRIVGQVGQELRLPVVESALREGGIEHPVQRRVRHRPHRIQHGRTERLERPEGRLALLERAAVAPTMPTSLAFEPSGAVCSAATSIASSGNDAQVSRKKRSTSSARGNGWATTPPVIIGPTGWSAYSSDAAMPKLPPPPRIAQNRSGFSSALARTTRAVGHHHVGGSQVVERQAVLRHQPAEPAAERQAGNPRAPDDAAGRRESVQLRLAVEFSPEHAALSARGPRARHPRECPSSATDRSSAHRRSSPGRRRCALRRVPRPRGRAYARGARRRRRRRRRDSGR